MPQRLMLAAIVLIVPAVMLAQSTPTDTLSVLLSEVRQLRITMERAALTSPRIQLLGSRLGVQNERLSRASGHLEGLRQNLNRLSASIAQMTAQLQQMEDALAGESDPERRRRLVQEQRSLKQVLDQQTAEEQRTRAQETDAYNAFAAEQAAWTELNRRLDELERELAVQR
jgi:uncharacterized phage infection (PIP) family protein YhgE